MRGQAWNILLIISGLITSILYYTLFLEYLIGSNYFVVMVFIATHGTLVGGLYMFRDAYLIQKRRDKRKRG